MSEVKKHEISQLSHLPFNVSINLILIHKTKLQLMDED